MKYELVNEEKYTEYSNRLLNQLENLDMSLVEFIIDRYNLEGITDLERKFTLFKQKIENTILDTIYDADVSDSENIFYICTGVNWGSRTDILEAFDAVLNPIGLPNKKNWKRVEYHDTGKPYLCLTYGESDNIFIYVNCFDDVFEYIYGTRFLDAIIAVRKYLKEEQILNNRLSDLGKKF